MPVKVVLSKPVAGIRKDTLLIKTIPSGALLDLGSEVGGGALEIRWEGACFTLLREDLLDACSVEDVWRIFNLRRSP